MGCHYTGVVYVGGPSAGIVYKGQQVFGVVSKVHFLRGSSTGIVCEGGTPRCCV